MIVRSPNRLIGHLASSWSTAEPDHPKYRPDIDGLRAIAVLSVVGFHAAPGRFPGGFIGVDIFFVISGYLISSIILRGLEAGTFTFLEFYSRRIKRIFPALILTLLACFAIGFAILPDDQFKELGKHIVGGAAFVSNLVLWSESGYFDNAADYKPLLHLWSLGIEEQFYVVWPLMLWLAWRWGSHCLAAILVVAFVSFAVNVFAISSDPVATFYSPITRFWELAVGSALAYSRVFAKSGPIVKSQSIFAAAGIVGAALLLIAFLAIDKRQPFPGWWALLPTVGTATIIWAGSRAWLNRVVLSNRVLVWFGLISYPLYLWHWPLLSFLRVLEGTEVAQWKRAIAILVAIILAWMTYRLIEKPIRQRPRSRSTLLALVSAMLIVGLVGSYGYFANGFEGRSGTPRVVNEGSIGHFDFFDHISTYFYPCTPLDIQKEAGDWNGIIRCFQSKDGVIRDVAILGDSHSEHLFPGLAEQLPESNVVLYAKGALPFISDSKFNRIFENVLGDKNTTVVVLSAYWARELKKYDVDVWKQELKGTVVALVNAGKSVYLIDDVPTFSFKPYKCKYAGRLGSENTCAENNSVDNAKYFSLFETIATEVGQGRVVVVRTYELFCEEGLCSMAGDGALYFRDRHHLNIQGSIMVGKRIAREILDQ